ncbi:MAG: alpha-E domain-containing protein [Gammaproteobacteria bacterium]
MLSRSAERLYWLARYLERAENTARLISVYMNLLYDLPVGVEMGWRNLLNICGAEETFFQRHKTANEQNVTKFLLTESSNPGAIFSSLTYARENIRTSRDLMPDEAWEQVNEMHLFINNNLESTANRRSRGLLLLEIMDGCQRFTGFLAGAMSHDHAYRFILLGRNIERADMTTRILDTGSLLLAENRSDKMREYENTLWVHVLKSLSALLMYRRHVRSRVKSGDVITYLLKDAHFPRSVRHCIEEIAGSIKKLPHSEGLIDNLTALEDYLMSIETKRITPAQLHELLDSIQSRLGVTHNQIAATWFLNDPARQKQEMVAS